MLVAAAVPVAIAAGALVLLGHRQSDHGTPGGHTPPSASQSHQRRSGGASGSPAASVKALPCTESIGTQPPERDMRIVLGVVALPASPGLPRALQTARSGARDPAARLFAKWGLTIRPGARLRLIVPTQLRSRLSISWGNAGEGHRGTTIVVNRCPGPAGAKWLSYAGGYFVRDPICATLIVAADRQRRRIQIGIGTPCPGQRPPPQPTEK